MSALLSPIEYFLERMDEAYDLSLLESDNPLILVCGNGGSASQAEHLVGELMGSFDGIVDPVASICLSSNTAVITALANDYGYEYIFSSQIEAYARPHAIFLALSTSGESENVVYALDAAKSKGMITFSITGDEFSTLAKNADHAINFSANTQRVQEETLRLIHLMAGRLKRIKAYGA